MDVLRLWTVWAHCNYTKFEALVLAYREDQAIELFHTRHKGRLSDLEAEASEIDVKVNQDQEPRVVESSSYDVM